MAFIVIGIESFLPKKEPLNIKRRGYITWLHTNIANKFLRNWFLEKFLKSREIRWSNTISLLKRIAFIQESMKIPLRRKLRLLIPFIERSLIRTLSKMNSISLDHKILNKAFWCKKHSFKIFKLIMHDSYWGPDLSHVESSEKW